MTNPLANYRPDNGSIWLAELERFCQAIRSNGGDDHTQIRLRTDNGFLYNINRLVANHSSGPVLEASVPDAAEPTPQVIGVVEWPSDSGEAPTLIVGAASLEELDRRFIKTMRDAIGDPDGSGDDELAAFVVERGWPADDASDHDILLWLTDLRTDQVSTMAMIYQVDGQGVAQEDSSGRYLCWCDSRAPIDKRPKCIHES